MDAELAAGWCRRAGFMREPHGAPTTAAIVICLFRAQFDDIDPTHELGTFARARGGLLQHRGTARSLRVAVDAVADSAANATIFQEGIARGVTMPRSVSISTPVTGLTGGAGSRPLPRRIPAVASSTSLKMYKVIDVDCLHRERTPGHSSAR